jgi:ABC-type transport system substrate-binding protein
MQQVGVDLDLEFQPSDTLFSVRDGALVRGTYDLAMYAWNSGFPPDPNAAAMYGSASFPDVSTSFEGSNYPRYDNPQFDQIIAQATMATSVNDRRALYCQAVNLWSNDLPVIPLFQWPSITVARTNLVNYRPAPNFTPETWNIWSWFIPV